MVAEGHTADTGGDDAYRAGHGQDAGTGRTGMSAVGAEVRAGSRTRGLRLEPQRVMSQLGINSLSS